MVTNIIKIKNPSPKFKDFINKLENKSAKAREELEQKQKKLNEPNNKRV